jgi:hypothetical protein
MAPSTLMALKKDIYSAGTLLLQKTNPQPPWLSGGVKKEFPRFRSLLEPQFPLGNPLFHPAVRATWFNFVNAFKKDFLRSPDRRNGSILRVLKNLARLLIVLEEKTGGVDHGSCKA